MKLVEEEIYNAEDEPTNKIENEKPKSKEKGSATNSQSKGKSKSSKN